MHCFCGTTDDLGYEGLHAHLLAAHPELVSVEVLGGRPRFVVACPLCDAQYVQQIKRGQATGTFVEEYAHEIRLVAADICAQHLIGEHPVALGLEELLEEPAPATDRPSRPITLSQRRNR
jgi:hypothetical protein